MNKNASKYTKIIILCVLVTLFTFLFPNNYANAALEPIIIKDVNSTPVGYISDLVSLNGVVFFTGYDDYKGSELWKSDGTEAGTVLVKDIRDGRDGSSPTGKVVFNENVYFQAYTSTSGYELWKSDGTESGTVMVKEIRSGTGSSSPASLFVLGNTLYFTANNGTNGKELWRSDGTDAGTYMVKDIRVGSSGGMDYFDNKCKFAAIGNTLYFTATNGTNGYELWKSDGTSGGTSMVKDIYVGSSNGAYPYNIYENFIVINDILYFPGNTAANGIALWRSDGTDAGTYMVKDNNLSLAYFNNFGGQLYFRGGTSQLWKSDGSDAGTVMIKDIDINPDYSTYMNYLYVIGSTIYFGGDDGYLGYELWKSDGTQDGTVMVKDIYEGAEASTPDRFILFNGTTYFSAEEATNGQELWTTNGTSGGTTLFKDIYTGSNSSVPSDFLIVGSKMFFSATDSHGEELWVTDGTSQGTEMVKEISIATDGSDPQFFASTESYFYFMADDGIHGYELWKTDGSEDGTQLVKDINPGDLDCYFSSTEMYGLGDTVYFLADDGVHGEELWKSDGTEVGTVMVKDIYPGEDDSYPYEFSSIGNTFIFSADDGVNGTELWRSDGTAAGTILVKDINPGIDGSVYSDYELTPMGDYLYFAADTASYGRELWRTDGTEAGTTLVKDIYPGTNSGSPMYFFVLNGVLYFRAYDATNGYELWKSDGTEAGTVMVKDINSGTVDSNPYEFASIGNVLYFVATTATEGKELWKSDGTEAGTVIVKDITVGSVGSSPSYLETMGGTLYFRASDVTYGVELWKSDGTSAGTIMVKDINPSGPSNVMYITALGDEIYFAAADPTNGTELWKSDGTEAGTVLVQDIFIGTTSSNPFDYREYNDTLIFNARSILYDTELMMLGVSFRKSNFNPSSGSTITTPIPTITFNTSSTGSCRLSLTDESYSDMSDNVTCSGSGTTSHTCISSDLGSSGTKNVYISCSNDVDYEDSSSTNTKLTYIYSNESPEEGVAITNLIPTLSGRDKATQLDISVLSAEFKTPERTVELFKGSGVGKIKVAESRVDMSVSNDWKDVKADADRTSKKSFVSGLDQAPGADASFTLYVPKGDRDDKVRLCLNSSSLVAVNRFCVPGSDLTEGNPNVNVVIEDGQEYWAISGVPDSGGISFESEVSIPLETPEENIPIISTNSETKDTITQEDETENDVDTDLPVEKVEDTITKEEEYTDTTTPFEKINIFGEKIIDFIRGISITEQQSKDVATGTLISLPVLTAISLAFGNTYIGALLIRVFSYILALFRIGKKKRNCGLVYNSVTKEPLSMAIVRIFSKDGRLVATEVTNQYGIFESSLPNDTYKLGVNINEFVFPSSLISGNQDLPYRNIYIGGDFNLSNHPISYSVPVDPINKSVIQEIKTVLRNRLVNISISLINIVILIGLTFSIISYIKVPNTFNLVLLIVYILTLLITVIMNSQGKYRFGTVRDIYEDRLEGLELSLIETEFGTNFAKRITDIKGKYRFIVPGGEYKLVSTDINYDLFLDRGLIFKGKKDKVMVISNNLIARKR